MGSIGGWIVGIVWIIAGEDLRQEVGEGVVDPFEDGGEAVPGARGQDRVHDDPLDQELGDECKNSESHDRGLG